MNAPHRLDVALVRRNLARSREQAVRMIVSGRIIVDGHTAHKPAQPVRCGSHVEVVPNGEDPEYVSRGGEKLAGALAVFGRRGLRAKGRRCLDLGASTGGFTDALLHEGASEVVCVDVGRRQLVAPLRDDPRTTVLESTDAREVTQEQIGGRADLVVADLSFISLTLVLPVLDHLTTPSADAVVLVKPQFEVGRGRLGKHGVVREPRLRLEAVRRVVAAAHDLGWGLQDVVPSPLPGPAGNVEYFLWLRAGPAHADEKAIDHAVRTGPGGEKVSE
ncbi:MAG: TlyA family rRNA (cytidine-2'-O)-methyltransferase [Propionibacteriales bacterium]|nr:TlyA family rRNA (cytidine-2'-O)-methyltransferase [Propionibacteriales bacterium]